MSDGENDRVREVDFVRVLVDGSRDNRRVDNDGVIGRHGFIAQLHAGVLRWKVDPDVFVQDERYPNLTCKMMIGKSVKCDASEQRMHYVAKSMWTPQHFCNSIVERLIPLIGCYNSLHS